MKLHDNSRFQGGLVVPGPTTNLLKSHRLIGVTCGEVGFPDFEENGTARVLEEAGQQGAADAHAAKSGSYRNVQNLTLVLGDQPGDQKADDLVIADGNAEIVEEVIGHGPFRGAGAGLLDGGNLVEVGWFAAADTCHIGLIMPVLLPLFFLFAQPFWEAKPPEKWTEPEIQMLRSDSPWAQKIGPEPGTLVYLATAQPIEEAEAELRVRSKSPGREPDADYQTYLSENREKSFVLAIPYDKIRGLEKVAESKKMESESVMVIGKKQHHILGYFPPTPWDPVLRLVFAREVQVGDKKVVFRLYLPGVEFPEREAEFQVKELIYHGKLAM